MHKTVPTANRTGQRWFSAAIGGAWRLVKQGTKIRDDATSPFYAELCALSAEHMPILVHKRTKYLANPDAEMNLRWFSELDDFVTHTIWPQLFEGALAEASDKKEVIDVLDEIVGAEQRRNAATNSADNIPHTSRFDTSWVT
jgi:hypothetical protein